LSRSEGAYARIRRPVWVDDHNRKESENPQKALIVFLIFLQTIYVAMVYGPLAACLVEAFPAKIRYTSLFLPYHIGNGIFGGLMLIGLYTCAATGKIYAGLHYPIAVAGLTFVVGSLALRETHGTKIWDEVSGDPRRLPTSFVRQSRR
jgi:hypothetical protein